MGTLESSNLHVSIFARCWICSRKHPKQTKVGRVRRVDKFKPLAEDVDNVRFQMIERFAYPMAIDAQSNAFTHRFACEGRTTHRSFVEFHSFRAIGYYKDILGLPGAVTPTIADGITGVLPAFGGNKDRWILWTSMPDTNRPGEPISLHDFQIDWGAAIAYGLA